MSFVKILSLFMVTRGRLRGRDSYGVWDGHVYTTIFKIV